MYWYILFVCTGKEEKVDQFLRDRLDSSIYNPFIPMFEKIYNISGRISKELEYLFPGYVFIESDLPGTDFAKGISKIVKSLKDIIRILSYGDSNEITVREDEKEMLLRLCNCDRCIESSTGIIVGSNIYIKEGPLTGLESIIKRIDRHKRSAVIDLKFMGEVRPISIALDIIEKV